MKFTYTTPSKTFDYEVKPDDVRKALAKIVFDLEFDCFDDKLVLGLIQIKPETIKTLIIASLMNTISGLDLQDQLEKDLYGDLKDYFEKEALKSQED